VSDKKPITDLCKSAPTFIRFLVHPIQPNFTLYPSRCMTAVELVCTVGFFTWGAFFFFIQKKKGEEALNLASFAFLDKDWIG